VQKDMQILFINFDILKDMYKMVVLIL